MNTDNRKSVILDKPIIQGGVDIEAGELVCLSSQQLESLKQQGIHSKPAPSKEKQ